MPIAEDSAGGSPVPVPTDLTTNLTGQATGSGTLDYTTGDIDIAVTVVDNGHNHILSNITDVQVNNAISGQILVYNGTVWANATNTAGITAIVQDLTPQLGGNLDLNNRNITGTGNIAITGTIDGRDVSADGTKLDGIESGATADQTAAQIKTAYESNANTNNFADADVSKLSGIEPGATADQTASQIKTAYESNADTNAFTDADHTKLDGIETSADVTDTTNVVASLTAGTNVTIAADGTISATGGTSGIAHVVDDTTPQLGGNLDLNSKNITGTGNIDIAGEVTLDTRLTVENTSGYGSLEVGGSQGGFIDLKSPMSDDHDLRIITTGLGGTIDGKTGNINLQRSSVTKLTVNTTGINVAGTVEFEGLSGTGSVTITDIADEDNMASNSATKLATQQSIKAYVDAQVGTVDTISEVLANGNTTGGTDIAVSANDDITFTDSSKAKFGASSDLEIYHDGSSSYIDDKGAGNLFIRSNDVFIDSYANANPRMIRALADGAVTLYYNGGTRLATEDDGVNITGTVTANDVTVSGNTPTLLLKDVNSSGTAAKALIQYEDSAGSTGYIGFASEFNEDFTINNYKSSNLDLRTNNTTSMRINSSGNVGINNTNPQSRLDVTGDIAVSGTVDGVDIAARDAVLTTTTNTANAALPKAGGTMTGDILFNDGVKAKFGDSNDLQIWHNGTDSYVYDTGEGDLILRGSSNIKLQSSSGTALSTFTAAGASTLYFSAAEKLATTTSGIDVTGNIDLADNGKLLLGASDDLQLYHDGTHNWIRDVGTGALFLDTNSAIHLYANGSENMLYAQPNAGVQVFYDNVKKLETTSTGINVTGATNTTGTSNTRQWSVGTAGAKMGIYALDNSTMYMRCESGTSTNLQFGTYDNIPIYTITNNTVRTTLLGNGNFGVGTTAPQVKLQTTVANASTEAIRITNDADSVRTHMFPAEIQAHNSNLTLNANDGGFATIIKTANTERMRIDSGGIDVTGKAKISASTTFNAPSLGSSSANAQLHLTNNDTNYGLVVGNNSADGHVWLQAQRTDGTATAYNMTLNEAGGNVGIGNTSPSALLEIGNSNDNTLGTTAGNVLDNLHITSDTTNSDKLLVQAKRTVSGSNWESASQRLQRKVDATLMGYMQLGNNASDLITFGKGASTEYMRISGDGNVGIGTAAPSYKLDVRGAANSDVGIQVKASGTGDVDAELRLDAANTGEALVRYARDGTTRAVSEYTNSNEWNFTTYNDDKIDFQPNSTNVLRLTDDNIYAYKTVNVTGGVTVSTNLNVGNATPAGGGTIESHVQSSSTPALITYSGSSLLRTHISFENSNGQVGKINTTGTQTFYVTSSDYRLKTDIQPMQGSIDRVKALKPCNFEWVNDGGRVDGFIAHEAQEVVPEAIVGDKDAMQDQQYVESEATGDIYTPAVKATYETIQVELTPAVDATYDEDGNELTPAVDATYEEQQQELTPAVDEIIHSSDVVEPDELEEGQRWRETTEKVMATRQVPDYQGIDQSKIVPLLTSALQDAIAKIEALETRLEALES